MSADVFWSPPVNFAAPERIVRLAPVLFAEAEEGAWRTINGAHVLIQGGVIARGPAALKGKKLSELAQGDTHAHTESGRRKNKPAKDDNLHTHAGGSKPHAHARTPGVTHVPLSPDAGHEHDGGVTHTHEGGDLPHSHGGPLNTLRAKPVEPGKEREEAERVLGSLPAHDRQFLTGIDMPAQAERRKAAEYMIAAGFPNHVNALNSLAAAKGDHIEVPPELFRRPEDSSPGVKGYREVLTHEMGHVIYNHLPDKMLDEWEEKIHPGGRNILAFAQHAEKTGEWNPTVYAGENPDEDFAETYRLHRSGGIDAEVKDRREGQRIQPGEQIKLGPARADFIATLARRLPALAGRGSALLLSID